MQFVVNLCHFDSRPVLLCLQKERLGHSLRPFFLRRQAPSQILSAPTIGVAIGVLWLMGRRFEDIRMEMMQYTQVISSLRQMMESVLGLQGLEAMLGSGCAVPVFNLC